MQVKQRTSINKAVSSQRDALAAVWDSVYPPGDRWKRAADGRQRQVSLEISIKADKSAKSEEKRELYGSNQKQRGGC